MHEICTYIACENNITTKKVLEWYKKGERERINAQGKDGRWKTVKLLVILGTVSVYLSRVKCEYNIHRLRTK